MAYKPGDLVNGCILIKRLEKLSHSNCYKWEKKYKCGKIFKGHIRRKSCGCLRKNKAIENAKKKIGLSFYNLYIKDVIGIEDNHVIILIKCKCGTEKKEINGCEFRYKSCGCCKNATRHSQNSPHAKLTNIEVISMRELYESGCYSIDQLCDIYNIKRNHAYKIINKKMWTHV